MTAKPFKKIAKWLSLLLLGLLLLVLALVMAIYTPWVQDAARQAVVNMMNRKPGTEFALESLRIRFPLEVTAGSLCWKQNGDTMVAVESLNADVRPLALLRGEVDVAEADLLNGVYNLGNTDSATMIRIHADSVHISPAKVRLSPMDISVDDGLIDGGRVSLWLNPDPPKTPTDTAAANPLTVRVRNLDVRRLGFDMQMLPTIDSLCVMIGSARLQNGAIDLKAQTVDIGSFTGNALDAAYIAADSATIANTRVAPVDSTAAPAKPWQVRVKEFAFDHSRGLYTTAGYKPLPGLDFGYIQVGDLSLSANDFYNCATTVDIPLKVHGTERCGVTLTADGTLHVTADGLKFDKFNVTTPNGTTLAADGSMGMGDMATDPSIPVQLTATGKVSVADVRLMFPVMKPYLAPFGARSALSADMDVAGTMGRLRIARLKLSVPGVFSLQGNGKLLNVMNPAKLGGDISMSGSLGQVEPWVKLLMPAAGVRIPPMSLTADVHMDRGAYSGNVHASTRGGEIGLDGSFNGRASDYDVALNTHNFPVDAFMPQLGVGTVTAQINAHGHGFDLASPQTFSNIDLNVPSLAYQGQTYTEISGTVALKDGHADYDLDSHNPGLDFALKGTADIAGDMYTVKAIADARSIDLYRLKMSQLEDTKLEAYMDVNATFNTRLTDVAATVSLQSLTYSTPVENFEVDDVLAHLNASDSVTNASVRNSDLYAYFSSPLGLDSLMGRVDRVMPVVDAVMARHQINVPILQEALPPFNLTIDGGNHNALTQILAGSKMGLKRLSLTASNDSLINIEGRVLQFTTPSMRLDTINLAINQEGDRLNYLTTVNNRPGSFDAWAHVNLHGYLETNKLALALHQQNIQGKTGFNVGADLTFNGDSTAVLRFDPLDPTIGYQPWTINQGNYVVYNFPHNHIDANLHMQGMGSHLNIYTEHAESTHAEDHNADEDLVVDIQGIKIQDWITINPFAPPMKGELGANMRINWHDKVLTGNGDVQLKDFVYGKERVGDFKADLNVLTNASGLMTADMALFVNGKKSITLKGALNDSTRTSPFNMDLTMIHFPLSTANAFLPGIATLGGDLNGSMDVSGDQADPKLNGYLQFDSATVAVTMLGTKFGISDTRIPVENSLARFDNFSIKACNDNPLSANGTVDITSFADPKINLAFKATNMQIVNANRAPKGADVYGKAFIDLDADVQGSLSLLRVDASLGLLSGTNVTYIFEDAASAIESQSTGDMVKFVNFADSSAVVKADSIVPAEGMQLILAAKLNIENGSTVNVELGAGSSDRVQIKSQGQLNYTMSPLNSPRLTGRLNINNGFVRYTPPMMSQKMFTFQEGSYVAFNGELMNPLLNIHAVDKIRANVTSKGQNSRLIDFDVSLGVTGSLNQMDVKFDLSTDDDATVANELASMSPTQRASTAMNMLVTNMYSVGDTKADGNLGGNALYSFLTSQLNSWAANTIKGVDLSFGINQYDNVRGGNSQQATSYSYRVSKSLFNDRFKIVVGGNYSTDANADENLSQNLINDISFEYLLNAQGTMVVRIFRHTGYESILEGEITQTGVGFVYKKKLRRLKDMFRFRRRRKAAQPTEVTAPADTPATLAAPHRADSLSSVTPVNNHSNDSI